MSTCSGGKGGGGGVRASQEEATGYEDVRGCMRRGWWWVGMSLGTRKPAETVKVCIL